MNLSVLMAAYNERQTIGTIVERVLAQPMVTELIIVDDGSTDGTREYLETAGAIDPRIRTVFHDANAGKGAAIRSGLVHATGDITIIQDADLEYSPSDYSAVVKPIEEGRTRVCYGSRVLNANNRYPLDWFRLGSFAVTLAANALYWMRLTDEPTGYKAFETPFLKSLPLKARGFELCPELTAWTRKRGERILEVPIGYQKRTVAEGKKIRWPDGLMALWTLFRLRFEST